MQFDAQTINAIAAASPEIVRFIEAKAPREIGSWNELGGDEYARAFAVAGTTGQDVIGDIYGSLLTVMEQGGTEEDFAELVTPILKRKGWLPGPQGLANRVNLIYDTNLRVARAVGRWQRVQKVAHVMPYLQGQTVGDPRVREEHRAFQGIVLPVNHWFWQEFWPPLFFRCFLPQTRIEGDVTAGVRRWHDGKAVEVSVGGSKLAVTPDHPILTGRGWVQAQHVRVGDYLIRSRRKVDSSPSAVIDDDNAPPRADDLFQAVQSHALGFGKMAAFQFADDTRGGVGKIDVAICDAELAQEMWAKTIGQGRFVRADRWSDLSRHACRSMLAEVPHLQAMQSGYPGNVAIAGPQPFAQFSERQPFPDQWDGHSFQFGVSGSGGFPSLPALPLHATRRLFDGLPLERFGLTSATHDDALFSELDAKGLAADSGLFGELAGSFPGEVTLDQVTDVREFDFCGHVFDFSTSERLIVADGIVTHNCRCDVVQLTRSQFARRGLVITPEAEVEARAAQIRPQSWGYNVAIAGLRALEEKAAAVPGMPPVDVTGLQAQGRGQWNALMGLAVGELVTGLIRALGGGESETGALLEV